MPDGLIDVDRPHSMGPSTRSRPSMSARTLAGPMPAAAPVTMIVLSCTPMLLDAVAEARFAAVPRYDHEDQQAKDDLLVGGPVPLSHQYGGENGEQERS